MGITMTSDANKPASRALALGGIGLLLLISITAIVSLLSRSTLSSAPQAFDSDAPRSLAAAPLRAGAGDQLLVWVGKGAAPGEHSAAEPGQLAFMDGSGLANPLFDIPPQTTRVAACGEGAASPDGSMFAFYVGLDAGKLYLKKGLDAPAPIGDVHALTCLGNGTFQYSPDSARIGWIAYEPGAEQSEFTDGTLRIVGSASLAEEFSASNVTAFDLTNDGAALVSFFTNDKNEADEAAIVWWNGSGQKEVATLSPASEDCKFTSASIAVLADGKFLLVMGHRCTKGETATSWQLYSVDPEARSATLAASDFQAGQFASFARTNSIFLSPDGARAYFTVPDGITANTVSIKSVSLADLALADALERQAVMPTLSGSANAFPRISPDGRWLALVVTSPDNNNSLQIWNLADTSVAPIILDAGSQGDTISSTAFTPDGKRLILVQGGDNGADNSLVAIDLATGNDFRIARGHFGRGLTVSPSGAEVALLDWQKLEDPKEPPFANTVIIGVDSSEVTTLYKGADITADNKVENQRFAFPMYWQTTPQ